MTSLRFSVGQCVPPVQAHPNASIFPLALARLRARAILFCLCALTAANAFGFADEGHQAIGAIADQLIKGTPSAAHVKALLGDETLTVASTWADQAKGWGPQTDEMKKFRAANPQNDRAHYTDMPIQETKYREDSIGTAKVDLIHAIDACVLILQGKPQAQSLFKEVDAKGALRLLVHFVGDVHQPLHVGAAFLDGTNFINPNGYTGQYDETHGGNWLMYGRHKLHLFWDIDVVRAAMARTNAATPEQFAKALLTRPAPKWKTSDNYTQWSREWANESLVVSAKIHALKVINRKMVPDRRTQVEHPEWQVQPIDPNYDTWAAKVTEDEILLAGYRVAALLNALWPDPPATR